VVIDGPIITSQGPGTAMEFALTLVEALFGPERKKQVAEPMLAAGY
jgi:4-methyl-5(b-hydroxyethyl)-thiazole monophosphate biosynthesis